MKTEKHELSQEEIDRLIKTNIHYAYPEIRPIDSITVHSGGSWQVFIFEDKRRNELELALMTRYEGNL